MSTPTSSKRLGALAGLLVIVLAVAGACGAESGAHGGSAIRVLQRAVDKAHSAKSFQVRGALGTAVLWEGRVVGNDEQYCRWAMGMLIDERRIAGVAWGRPVDRSQPWTSVASDGSFDLGVLLEGDVTASTMTEDHTVVRLHFTGDDVLRALSHIPSTGPTDATVTIQAGLITDIDLQQFPGATPAHIELWDYATPLVVEPIDISTPCPPGA